jgi:hypothetical protein
MQHIDITTSTQMVPDNHLSMTEPIRMLRNNWRVDFEFKYINWEGDLTVERTLTYEFTTRESPPFSLEELGRLRRLMKYIGHERTPRIHPAGPFLFDRDYSIHMDDAGHVLELFAGVFTYEDMTTIQEPQKQLTNGKKALPAADR